MPKKTTADVKKTKKKDFETVAEISAPATVPEIEVTPKKKILLWRRKVRRSSRREGLRK